MAAGFGVMLQLWGNASFPDFSLFMRHRSAQSYL